MAIAAIPSVLFALAACSSSPASSTAAPPAVTAPAAQSAAPAPTLGPLTLGHFPATADGRLARDICEAWQGLRSQYAANVANDTPYQLNQWFSSAAWQTEHSDASKLNDPAYASLEGALGVATVGDTASLAVAREVDKACAAG